jgi:DNA polymerase-3 subunit beta
MAKQPEYPKHVAAVRLEAALRVRPFVSDELMRYYLCGVYIDAGEAGALCIATDGHRLGVRHDKEGLSREPVIVKLPKLLKLTKEPKWLVVTLTAAGKGFISVVPVITDDTPEDAMGRVEEAELRIGDAVIDGTFPDWKRVVPPADPRDMHRGFNAKYVASFGERISICGASDNAPHLVSDAADPDFVGVIMPMRADPPKVPSWLGLVKQDKAA